MSSHSVAQSDILKESEFCDGSTAWDGVLCQSCRRVFDHHVRTIDSDPVPQIVGDEIFWWHTMQSLEACAKKSCKLCTIALDRTAKKEAFDQPRSWNAALRVSIQSDVEGKQTIHVWCSERDFFTTPSDVDLSSTQQFTIVLLMLKIEKLESELLCHYAIIQCSYLV